MNILCCGRLVTSHFDHRAQIWNIEDYINSSESLCLVVYASVAHFVEIGTELVLLIRRVWIHNSVELD